MQPQTANTIRIAVADAYPIMRTGLVTTIEREPHMQVVGVTAQCADLMPLLQATSAQVLVINLIGMGAAPVALLRRIKQAQPRVGIVVYTATVDFAPEILAAGVQAYVTYTESDACLHDAICAAQAHQTYVSPQTQDYVERHDLVVARHRFAPRELEILKYLAEGLNAHEIADRLDRDYQTVRNYIWSIRRKTGWTTWPQMVSWYHTMYGNA